VISKDFCGERVEAVALRGLEPVHHSERALARHIRQQLQQRSDADRVTGWRSPRWRGSHGFAPDTGRRCRQDGETPGGRDRITALDARSTRNGREVATLDFASFYGCLTLPGAYRRRMGNDEHNRLLYAGCGDVIGVYERAWIEERDGTWHPSSGLNLADAARASARGVWHASCAVNDGPPDPG
jgi:hypothetical protein